LSKSRRVACLSSLLCDTASCPCSRLSVPQAQALEMEVQFWTCAKAEAESHVAELCNARKRRGPTIFAIAEDGDGACCCVVHCRSCHPLPV
jgi:hypothetical protein